MDSFYGGRKGRDFTITPANKQENKLAFDNKVALVDDLKQRWQSPIGVGDYVLVSYGMASDSGYATKLQKDLDAYKKSYNSTLWEKIYTESEYTGKDTEVIFLSNKRGLGYRLVTSMTGNTPKFVSDVTVNPVSPDTPPTASIDSKNADSPQLILNLPQAQYMTVKEKVVDATDSPDIDWEDTFIDTDGETKKLVNPILTLSLPESQVIQFKDPVIEDASTPPSMVWDATDDPTKEPGDKTNKVNRPELTLHLPQAQVLKNDHITLLPQDVTTKPSVKLVTTGTNSDGSKKINEPELIFELPVAQSINWLGLVELLDAGAAPEIVWDNNDIAAEPDGSDANTLNKPKLGFKLPRGQVFRRSSDGIQVRFTDAGKQPSVALDTSGTWPDGTLKINEPGLIFTLPLSQKISFLGWNSGNVLDANEEPRVEWKDTDDPSQDGVQSDLNNTPTLELFLPRAQVLQEPTQIPVGPTIAPSVKDIGTVNAPKYEFSLPKAVQFYTIDDITQTSTGYFIISIPDAKYDKMEVGDYLINTATGFLYRVSEKTLTTIKFTYEARFSVYVPETGEKSIVAFSKNASDEWQRNQITVEKKYLDVAQTKVQFLFTIPNQPRFEFTVTPLAPAETMGISSPSIKDDSTITQDLKIPRGSRIFVQDTPSTLGENGDVWINNKTGDLYNHDDISWGTSLGSLKGPSGDALNIIKSFDYDNITERTADTLDTVSKLLERDLGITAGTGSYPEPDQLIKVTWTQKDITTKDVLSEISYWYFYLPEKRWDRAQVTAGLGDVITNVYSKDNEDNKTYSVGYINGLINDAATTDLDKKTYSIQKINKMTSWQDLTSSMTSPLQLYKGTDLPTTIKEGSVYLISVKDAGNNLFVDISNSKRVQISAASLSKPVADGSGGTSYIIVEPEDVVTKSKIANAAENAVLVGATRNRFGTYDIKAIPNVGGTFYSDGLSAPKFGVLPLSAGGVGATDASGARDTLEVYSKIETEDLITWGNFTDLI